MTSRQSYSESPCVVFLIVSIPTLKWCQIDASMIGSMLSFVSLSYVQYVVPISSNSTHVCANFPYASTLSPSPSSAVFCSQCDSVALSRQIQASVSEKAEHHVEICCSCIRKFPKRCRKKFSTEAAKPIHRNIRKNMKTLELVFFFAGAKKI